MTFSILKRVSRYQARLPSVTYKLIFKKKYANYPGTVRLHSHVCLLGALIC